MATPDSTTKACSICKQQLPATREYFAKKGNGLASTCKPCSAEWQRNYRRENPEATRKSEGARDKERRRVIHRAWLDRHPNYHRDWYRNHAEQRREAVRKSHKKHPESSRQSSKARRTRKRQLPADFTVEQWKYCLEYFNGCCAVCGKQLYDLFGSLHASQDHWIPLSKDGGYTAMNIIPLCSGINGCNQQKQDHDPIEWLNRKFGTRKAKQILNRIATYFDWVNNATP